MSRVLSVLVALAIAVAFIGCNGGSTDVEPNTDGAIRSCLKKDGSTFSWQDLTPAQFDTVAGYDFLLTSEGSWKGEWRRKYADSLWTRNPGMRLGQYFRALSLPQWVIRQAGEGSEYCQRWYDLVSPYLARTNEIDPETGELDTASVWLADYAINLLNPAAREANIRAQIEYEGADVLTWLMVDYLSSPLPNLKRFQPPIYEELEHGDLDLDGDGIGHWDDVDEQQALHEAMLAYMVEMRDIIGEDWQIVVNGKLALLDNRFDEVVDGMYLEGFPMWLFCGERPCFAEALDPSNSETLWDLVDRYDILMLEDRFDSRKFGHLGALWDDTIELKRWWYREEPQSLDTSRDLKVELGNALGPCRYASPDSIIRSFQGGDVWVRFGENSLSVGIR